jgi:hypothetical protein
MIRKGGHLFSEKIMLNQESRSAMAIFAIALQAASPLTQPQDSTCAFS